MLFLGFCPTDVAREAQMIRMTRSANAVEVPHHLVTASRQTMTEIRTRNQEPALIEDVPQLIVILTGN